MNILAADFWANAWLVITDYVWPFVLALLILLAMITVHEFGHYVAGKILKFKINEFAIGFGPALFKKASKKTGEVFSVRLLPLGGFCAFAGEDEIETEQQKVEEANKIQPFEEDFSEQNSNAEVKDISEEEQIVESKRNKEGDFNERPPWMRIIVLLAGATMNYLLALIAIIISFSAFGQATYKVNSIAENASYSSEYSFASNDVILQAEGRTIYLATDIITALNGMKEGELAEFTVIRGGEKQKIEVMLRANCDFENSSQTSKMWKAMGIGITEDGLYYDLSVEYRHMGFFETLGKSFGYSFRLAGTIFNFLGELLTGKVSLDMVGGPVTTIKVTSEMATQSMQSFFEIVAYIGVNLAVFNLLPIPALDGSKIIFCAIEWIFKKPVPRNIEAIIHLVGMISLFGFAILVDILQFV